MSTIICSNVSKSYKQKKVLNDLSFECKDEIAFIAGKNGAGKTTFIRIALGLESCDKGNVFLRSESDNNTISKGVVFDTPSLYPGISCKRNIDILCTGFLKDKNFVEDTLNNLDINEEILHKKAEQCSFGQQHRVSVAIALIRKPQFLFLDEPTIGLDPLSWELVKTSIIKNRKKQNGCVIITGQDYFEMATFSDKLIILDEGKAKYEGKTSDFLKSFSNSLSLITHSELPISLHSKLSTTINLEGNLKKYIFSELTDKNEILSLIQSNNIDVVNISTEQISLKDAVYSVIKK